MTHYGMAIDLSRCIGCHTCAIACKMANNLPKNVLFNRVRTVGGDGMDTASGEYGANTMSFLPMQCQHCENPACLDVCPTGATAKDEETGIVSVDSELCIGCESCLKGCPYNVRTLNPNTNVVEKCTLCFQRHEEEDWVPACVHNCCCGARYFGDLDDPESDVSKLRAAKKTYKLKDVGNHPGVDYAMDKCAWKGDE